MATRSRRLCVYIELADADEKMATVALMADNDNNSVEKPLLFPSSPMYMPLKGIHSVNTNNNNDSRRVRVCVCLTASHNIVNLSGNLSRLFFMELYIVDVQISM